MDKEKIKELIELGYKEFEKVRKSPTMYSLSTAFTSRDILEEIEKEIEK